MAGKVFEELRHGVKSAPEFFLPLQPLSHSGGSGKVSQRKGRRWDLQCRAGSLGFGAAGLQIPLL